MARGHRAELRMVERARIILACTEGKQNQEIAVELETSVPRIGKWRRRFAEQGLAGLEDTLRPGNRRPTEKRLGISCSLSWIPHLRKAWPGGIARHRQRN